MDRKFDYRKYLAEGWMQQEIESPESITSEENLYRWVEANCNNLDDILRLNPKELQEPVSVAKEEGLSPREFIEDWVTEYGDWVDIAEMLGLKAVYGPKHKSGSLYLHESDMDTFNIRKYLTEGWLLKESNEDHILFNRVEELVKELADSDGIVDLRPAGLDLTWIDEEGDSTSEIGAYLLSLGRDGKIYVSTGPEDSPKSGDTITLERYCSLLQENGAIAHDVDIMLDAIVEALEILKEGETELNEAENFNDEKYPKAEAWLEEHPDIKYFNEVPEQFLQYDIDKEDDPDSENIETAITEAGYMFISELEAALEGGKDDEYLESCAMNGVINDPTYNPPVDSWDYRIR